MSEERSGDGEGRSVLDVLHAALWQVAMPVGTGMVALSAFVFVFTFPMRLSHRILIAPLVPYFGIPFAMAYFALQLGLLAAMRSWKGIALAAAVFAAAAGLGWVGMYGPLPYSDVSAEGFSAARHMLCAGSVVSGFVVGLSLLKGWLRKS
jgi:hypothetical protein